MSDVRKRAVVTASPETKDDWKGRTGRWFRKLFKRTADIATKHVDVEELAAAGMDALVEGGRKAKYENEQKQSEALKNFAETEKSNLEAELLRRTMNADVQAKEANARHKSANALMAEITAIGKLVELQELLNEKGLAVVNDKDGGFQIVPAPKVDYGNPPSLEELDHEVEDSDDR